MHSERAQEVMREIKFRAWYSSDDHSTMLYWFPENPSTPYYVEGLDRPFNLHAYLWNNPNHTVMQYTGLKDRNGKEIYEGDIINLYPTFSDSLVLVEWISQEEYWAGFSPFNGDNSADPSRVEVVGNIYENPELLEKS